MAAAIATMAAVGAATVQAATATSDYPSSAAARTFATSVGGWQSTKFDTGLTCVLKPLTCPVLTNSWQSSGGASGDGYVRTSLGALTGVASDSFGAWVSPAFTYDGVNGQTPTSLALSFDRKANDANLVDPDIGNQVTYTASIVDTGTGNVVAQPIDGRTATPASRWTAVGPASVDPSALKVGHSYEVAIVTEFKTGARVIPGGSVGYDNVDLEATLASSPPGPGPRPGPRFLNWHRLIVQSKCPRSLHTHTCQIHLLTYLRGFTGAHPTLAKTVRRRGHGLRTISLRVRPTNNGWARNLVKHGGRLHVRQTVKAHHKARSSNAKLRVVAFRKP